MHRRSVAVFDRFLSALGAILDKAEAHCTARNIKPEVILAARLFPDMFSFTRQVQLACDFAARGTARLAGVEPKGFPDTEATFAELKDRIRATRGYMGSFQPEDFAHAETREIRFKAGGRDMVLPGEEFLSFYSLPQFFFHLTTAYDILRHNGVELGKRDYMGAP
ncbi:DUF1993 domain-containing protein [Rhodobacter calidifons]|uniref:DUF1993 domain-containing protein n=1 Tax=Rhodobacter calidifons TaxID=2715277 RepID=A0ABX0G2S3_9RHOB|nr:DUF1993 domain-containing protein [Rhodobacter calidifons]NHB75497.1 DUF1993 domain-containing protein [Rhodobacter calidifons]